MMARGESFTEALESPPGGQPAATQADRLQAHAFSTGTLGAVPDPPEQCADVSLFPVAAGGDEGGRSGQGDGAFSRQIKHKCLASRLAIATPRKAFCRFASK